MKGPFFIFLLLMPAFFVLIFLILVAMQYKQLKALVSPHPLELAQVPSSPESRARVRAKVEGFLTVPKASENTANDTLALDASDLNELIRASEALENLHLDYHLSLEDTLLVARNSLPVEEMKGVLATMARLLHVHGYLNSVMSGYPKVEDGKLYMIPISAVMNGVAAPTAVLSSKGKIEAREWVSDKEAFDRATAHLADVRIRAGRLLLIRN